ncbi:MAG: hypothetical protein JNN02_09200 [Tabrizicola sp.]|nr:hypothetical protein [Tabrizicola sp.]
MTPNHTIETSALRAALNEIIRVHGLWPVLRTTLAEAFRRPGSRPELHRISNHLRRDIGLEPLDDPAPRIRAGRLSDDPLAGQARCR